MYRFVFYVTAVLTKHLIFKSFLRVFHPTPEGPTKAQKKAAAITIQRFVPFFARSGTVVTLKKGNLGVGQTSNFSGDKLNLGS